MLFPLNVGAARGCCSHHGGVNGCSSSGRQICRDGTLSPSCTCTPVITYTYGCTDKNAINFNPNADKNDGSCVYYVYGCTDKLAKNYNSKANKDDGSCEFSTNNDLNKLEDNESQENEDDSGVLNTIITISAISGGVYLYRKRKKK